MPLPQSYLGRSTVSFLKEVGHREMKLVRGKGDGCFAMRKKAPVGKVVIQIVLHKFPERQSVT